MSMRKRSFRHEPGHNDENQELVTKEKCPQLTIPMALFKTLPIQNHSVPVYRGDEPCLWHNPLDPAFHETVVQTGHMIHFMNCKGANRRAVVFLIAFIQALYAYRPHRYSQHSTEKHIKTLTERTISFLKACRPHNIATGNAIRWVKETLLPECNHHDNHWRSSSGMAKELLFFVRERFSLAQTNVTRTLCKLLTDTPELDICTFGKSTTVLAAIKAVYQTVTKNLRVYCVNDAPLHEGTEMAQMLVDNGLPFVEIVPIASFGTVASRRIRSRAVFLIGAVTLTTNGAVLSRAGTMICASTARANKVPVITLCFTFKFSSRCLMDPYSHNELYDPHTLISNYKRQKTPIMRNRIVELQAAEKSRRYIQGSPTFSGPNGDRWRKYSQSRLIVDTSERINVEALSGRLEERSKDPIYGRYLSGHARPSLRLPVPLPKNENLINMNGMAMRLDDKALQFTMQIRPPQHLSPTMPSAQDDGDDRWHVNDTAIGSATGPPSSNSTGFTRNPFPHGGNTRRASRASSLTGSLEPNALLPLYDLTGPSLIDTVVTEIGLINCSDSVRIMRDYDGKL